jgi:teichuronopeptide biosynthesis TupA-like protein
MGWGLKGRAYRIVDRASAAVDAVLPESAAIAFSAIRRHKRNIGVFPNLLQPRTFNEKVLYRMVFDRRLILTTLQDKYAARQYVRDKLTDRVLPRLYCVTKNPADIPFDKLPDRFVVKATHGCGFNYVAYDKARINRGEVLAQCATWLDSNFYRVNLEWVYKHVEPRIMVEEFIDDGTGPDPIRYKLYTFHGTVQAIYVGVGMPGQARCAFYDRFWNRLPATLSRKVQIDADLARPKHFDEMIRYAEVLGHGLDFIRVDLYHAPDKVYFGEFTTIPGAGTEPFHPIEFDRHLGAQW